MVSSKGHPIVENKGGDIANILILLMELLMITVDYEVLNRTLIIYITINVSILYSLGKHPIF
jgi:hypothetical protein